MLSGFEQQFPKPGCKKPSPAHPLSFASEPKQLLGRSREGVEVPLQRVVACSRWSTRWGNPILMSAVACAFFWSLLSFRYLLGERNNTCLLSNVKAVFWSTPVFCGPTASCFGRPGILRLRFVVVAARAKPCLLAWFETMVGRAMDQPMRTAAFLKRRARAAAMRLVGPWVLIGIPLFWVLDATIRATLTTLGRDQGIFQYIAWAVSNGEVDYRDVRDVNGPLVHLIHLIFLRLGGGDEHRFHALDMLMTSASFLATGAIVASWASRRRLSVPERISWACAGWVVLAGQHALYTYWNQAQRESFADWFLLPSLALQAGLRETDDDSHSNWRVVTIGALTSLAIFAKSTFVFFLAAQGLALVVTFGRRHWWKKLSLLGAGVIAGAAPSVAYLLLRGDLVAFARITTHDVPEIYRFIWAKSIREIFGEDGPLAAGALALFAASAVFGLVALGSLPRRAFVLGAAPLAGIAAVCAQKKGFGYHFHPVTATAHLALFALLISLLAHRRLARGLFLGSCAAFGLFIVNAMRSSPHTRNVWILGGGETPKDRLSREYFDTFKTGDFFPWELRQAAQYLRKTTNSHGRVQTYGMDPYLLFLAERKSATPYIYAYDLNADAALEGGWSNRPTPLEQAKIIAWRNDHERDLLSRLQASPPEAFVFLDKSPLISWQDAWEDFRHCCRTSAEWVATHYHPARSFGEIHVWLRDDSPVPDREGIP